MQYYSSQDLAYFQAQAELKKKVNDDLMKINGEINKIICQQNIYNESDESTDASSSDDEASTLDHKSLEVPLTQPIRHVPESDDEEEEDEEELLQQMRALLKQQGGKPKAGSKSSDSKKKIKILQPLQEEGYEKTVSRDAYKQVFKRCHQDLKEMRIGKQSKGNFFKSAEKLNFIIEQLNEIKSQQC